MCKRTHCVQNYTGVPFAFNMKKFLSLEIFYTHAVTDVTDKYEVCIFDILELPAFQKYSM